tara:strand:- start:2270 stop:2593 length:324 start_codon:yes stop_codon:yes gene_type:complete
MPFHYKKFTNKIRKTNTLVRKLKLENQEKSSLKEIQDEQRNEEIQQGDIDKEKDLIKKDLVEQMERFNEKTIGRKLKDLLKKLPADDKLRNLLDQDRESKMNPSMNE